MERTAPIFSCCVLPCMLLQQDKIADAPKRWQREWEDMNRMSSRRQDPKSNESQAKGVNGNGIAVGCLFLFSVHVLLRRSSS